MLKVAVYTLYQSHERSKVNVFIRNLKSELGENTQLFVLNNGLYDRGIVEHCHEESEFIEVLCENRNLGVASGRNFLLKEMINRDYDLFISLDNDIIIPNDYVQNIVSAYKTLKKKYHNLGIMQPVLLDGPIFREETVHKYFDASTWDELSDRECSITAINLKDLLTNRFRDGMFYHIGVTNVLNAHFGGVIDESIHAELGSALTDHWRYSDLTVLEAIESGTYLPIQTAAGGVTVIDKDVAKEYKYSKKFDPFLYEDSELGFRLALDGKKNFLLTNSYCVHDPFCQGNRNINDFTVLGRLRGKEICELYEKNITLSDFPKINPFDVSGYLKRLRYTGDQVDFYFTYILNLIFGLFGEEVDLFKSLPGQHLFRILFGKLLENHAISARKRTIWLNSESSFVFSDLILSSRTNLGVTLKNCHFLSGGKSSRYFDLYLLFKQVDDFSYISSLNIQANESVFSIKISVDCKDWYEELGRKLISFEIVEVHHKEYDYGCFSVEELYPKPSLFLQKSEIEDSLSTFFGGVNDIKSESYILNLLISLLSDTKRAETDLDDRKETVDFSGANELFRAREYDKAFSAYSGLYNSDPKCKVYQQALFMALSKYLAEEEKINEEMKSFLQRVIDV